MGARCLTIHPGPAARGPISNFAWRYWNVTRERRLGRGLAALLGESLDAPEDRQQPEEHPAPRLHQPTEEAGHVEPPAIQHSEAVETDFIRLGVYDIDDNPFQPRRDFSE